MGLRGEVDDGIHIRQMREIHDVAGAVAEGPVVQEGEVGRIGPRIDDPDLIAPGQELGDDFPPNKT